MPVKLYLCPKVQYAFIEDVVSISKTEIILIDGRTLKTIEGDNFQFKEQYVKGTNDYVSQTLTCDSLTNIAMLNGFFERQMVFKLYLAEGGIFIWGSMDKFVRRSATEVKTNESGITLYRKTERFEFEPVYPVQIVPVPVPVPDPIPDPIPDPEPEPINPISLLDFNWAFKQQGWTVDRDDTYQWMNYDFDGTVMERDLRAESLLGYFGGVNYKAFFYLFEATIKPTIVRHGKYTVSFEYLHQNLHADIEKLAILVEGLGEGLITWATIHNRSFIPDTADIWHSISIDFITEQDSYAWLDLKRFAFAIIIDSDYVEIGTTLTPSSDMAISIRNISITETV